MKQGKSRTLSICVSDIPKDRIIKLSNSKLYMNISTWDYDEPDKYDNDFSIAMSHTKEELERKKAGEKVNKIFIGNGKIWETNSPQPITEKDLENLPF